MHERNSCIGSQLFVVFMQKGVGSERMEVRMAI